MVYQIPKLAVDSVMLKCKLAANKLVKPVFLNFPITYKCNLRCQMCGIWKRYSKGNEASKELSLQEIKQVFLKNKEFLSEVRHMGITGGEAFLRQDIVEIMRFFRQEFPKIAVGIQTNGLAVKKIIKDIKEILEFYPEFSLAVSIDGIGKTHDKIRGVKGSFKNALKTIKEAQKLGLKSLTIGMVVSETNYKEIMKVAKLAEKYNADFSCFLADEGDYFNNKGNKPKGISKKALAAIIKDLKKFKHHYFMDNLRRQLEFGEKRTLPCYSGITSLVIDPYGNLRPCIILQDSFGSLKTNTMKELLSSSKAQQIKEKIKKCACWNQCEVSTSAIMDFFNVAKWFLKTPAKKAFIKNFAKKNS